MYRDILVHVDGGTAARRRVQFAFDLATRTCARVTGLHVTPPAEVPPRFKPSLVAGVAVEISSRLTLDASAAAAIFREEAVRRMPDSSWFEAEGDVAKGIAARARYSDVVIIGQYERQGSPETHPLPVAHVVHLRCGRPVLVVPASARLSGPSRIAIAWDGSRESVRAMHDALPLLRQSRSVQIMTLSGSRTEDREDAGECLAAHLSNHGVPVESNVLGSRSTKEHELRLRRIEEDEFDLLVMGGYSRAMWREFVFGGTTQSILLTSKVAVFVSH
jgi:nucleotide-binding universal stress UspA family protein